MDDAIKTRARTMAECGAAILNASSEVGNWPAIIAKADFSDDATTPLALISPTSRVEDGLGMLDITFQTAHDSLLVRRGDIPAAVAAEAWRAIVAEHQLAGART